MSSATILIFDRALPASSFHRSCRMRPITTTPVPLVRRCAQYAGSFGHISTSKNDASPSTHCPDSSFFFGVCAILNDTTDLPVDVALISGSLVRLPSTVMLLIISLTPSPLWRIIHNIPLYGLCQALKVLLLRLNRQLLAYSSGARLNLLHPTFQSYSGYNFLHPASAILLTPAICRYNMPAAFHRIPVSSEFQRMSPVRR
jgi:hypothetical protein